MGRPRRRRHIDWALLARNPLALHSFEKKNVSTFILRKSLQLAGPLTSYFAGPKGGGGASTASGMAMRWYHDSRQGQENDLAGSPAAREGFLALDSEVRKIEASICSRSSGSVEKREDVVVVVAIRKFKLQTTSRRGYKASRVNSNHVSGRRTDEDTSSKRVYQSTIRISTLLQTCVRLLQTLCLCYYLFLL